MPKFVPKPKGAQLKKRKQPTKPYSPFISIEEPLFLSADDVVWLWELGIRVDDGRFVIAERVWLLMGQFA